MSNPLSSFPSFVLALSVSSALLAPAVALAQTTETELPPVVITGSRLGDGVVGASTTVIGHDEIQRSPGDTIQDVLARQPGIQTRSLYGGVNGAGTTVDMRGFGAAASANTLILVNGRRLNDIDLGGIDFSAIPKESIERIEVIRGNSGSVLYGDGAMGGVINIITSGAQRPGYSVDAGIGTLGLREAGGSARQSIGGFEMAAYGNFVNSHGYRDNNKLLQRNANGDIRKRMDFGDLYANFSLDDQQLGAPGARRVTLTSSLLAAGRQNAATPNDYANKQGQNLTLGGTYLMGNNADLVIDTGVRRKLQDASLSSSYVDTELTTFSFTPRLNLENRLFDKGLKSIFGFDFYYSDYESDRKNSINERPIHRYNADQQSYALYGQSTFAVSAATDLSTGLRLQRSVVTAGDSFDPNAPGASGVGGLGFNDQELNYAFHVGFEHRIDPALALFGRIGRSFRFPTLDERIGMAPFGVSPSFVLKTQTSHDAELGVSGKLGDAGYRLSAYIMRLKDELHFNPSNFTNVNLDPTQRRGIEASGDYKLTPEVRLRGGAAYTEAEFREGRNAGNRVPLVSPFTGNLGLSWDILPKQLLLDVDARFVDARRMDNDQANFQPQIPAFMLLDLRLGGSLDNRLRWSLLVQNLLDRKYFDYSIASSSTFGTYNAYPQPGRTAVARISLDF